MKDRLFSKKHHRRLKPWVKVAIIIIGAILVCLIGVKIYQLNSQNNNAVSSSTVSVSSSSAVSSSKAESSSVAPVSSSVAAQSSDEGADANEDGFFKDTVFTGDSLTVDMVNFEEFNDADIVGGIGVSAYRAVTDHEVAINGKKSDTAYMPDRVAKYKPKKIYMMFGCNDLTWGDQMSEKKFIGYYTQLIDTLKEKCPDAKIYIQSIMPITAAMENKKNTPFDNKKVDQFNAGLKQLAAQKGAKYLDVASIVRGKDGKLPSGVSDDGIHLKAKEYKLWVQYLLKNY